MPAWTCTCCFSRVGDYHHWIDRHWGGEMLMNTMDSSYLHLARGCRYARCYWRRKTWGPAQGTCQTWTHWGTVQTSPGITTGSDGYQGASPLDVTLAQLQETNPCQPCRRWARTALITSLQLISVAPSILKGQWVLFDMIPEVYLTKLILPYLLILWSY